MKDAGSSFPTENTFCGGGYLPFCEQLWEGGVRQGLRLIEEP